MGKVSDIQTLHITFQHDRSSHICDSQELVHNREVNHGCFQALMSVESALDIRL